MGITLTLYIDICGIIMSTGMHKDIRKSPDVHTHTSSNQHHVNAVDQNPKKSVTHTRHCPTASLKSIALTHGIRAINRS